MADQKPDVEQAQLDLEQAQREERLRGRIRQAQVQAKVRLLVAQQQSAATPLDTAYQI